MIHKPTKSIALPALLATLAFVEPASGADSTQNLGQEASNPLANLIGVPLQFNANFDTGPDDKTQNVLSI